VPVTDVPGGQRIEGGRGAAGEEAGLLQLMVDGALGGASQTRGLGHDRPAGDLVLIPAGERGRPGLVRGQGRRVPVGRPDRVPVAVQAGGHPRVLGPVLQFQEPLDAAGLSLRDGAVLGGDRSVNSASSSRTRWSIVGSGRYDSRGSGAGAGAGAGADAGGGKASTGAGAAAGSCGSGGAGSEEWWSSSGTGGGA
jgi:hypothetical protein